MKDREIRDPIHGFINRSRDEEKIIDSPPFQRLRYIKQLALANLVYPGALHTRFEHSIGVMHIAGRILERFPQLDEYKYLIRLAALLHDIGHGPFSHVSEYILGKYFDKSVTTGGNTEKIHEDITCKIIQYNEDLKKCIKSDDRDYIINLLMGNKTNNFAKGIVSGPLDADKQDYLLRDSYYCGVKYGVYDLDRFIYSLTTTRDIDSELLSIREEGIESLEQFIIAKYHMNLQVYRHKVRLLTDSMIIRGIELGIEEDNIDWLKKLYTYDGSDVFIDNYLKWNDQRLMDEIIFNTVHGYAFEIFDRLSKRRLFKRIYSRQINKEEFSNSKVRLSLSKLHKVPKVRKLVEEEISNYLKKHINNKICKLNVIVKSYSFKPIHQPNNPSVENDNVGQVMVKPRNEFSNPSIFANKSHIFSSIENSHSIELIEVYAPIEYDSDEDKKLKLKKINKNIHNIIVDNIINNQNLF